MFNNYMTLARCRLKALASLLIAVLLLPAFLVLIPRPALSPEQALLRDLKISLCSPSKTTDQVPNERHDAGCQLCLVGCYASLAIIGKESNASLFLMAHAGAQQVLGEYRVPIKHPHSGRIASPRGPPKPI